MRGCQRAGSPPPPQGTGHPGGSGTASSFHGDFSVSRSAFFAATQTLFATSQGTCSSVLAVGTAGKRKDSIPATRVRVEGRREDTEKARQPGKGGGCRLATTRAPHAHPPSECTCVSPTAPEHSSTARKELYVPVRAKWSQHGLQSFLWLRLNAG